VYPGEQWSVGFTVKLEEAPTDYEALESMLQKYCGQYWNTLLGEFYIGEGHPHYGMHDAQQFAPHMKYCGRVERFVPYKDKRMTDAFVKEWLSADNVKFEEKYRMCNPVSKHMTSSIAKYNRPQPALVDNFWRLAGDWTERHFSPFCSDTVVVPLQKAVGEADRQTSAGYPWSRWFKNKGEFLDSEAFTKVMPRFWETLATDDPFVSFWTASLKRELRPIAKLEKIRTFTASAAEASIACNRLCLDFNERFYASNNKTWSFVGCSKYNLGFHRLYHRLNAHPNAYALDESAFDSSLFRAAMYGQRDLRWRMMSSCHKDPETRSRLWNIYDQIVNSIIVLDNGEVYQKNTGNPSGSANTIVDNTMILFRLFAYAWIVITHENPHLVSYRSYGAFMNNVEAALNGDDNTYTCSEEANKFFHAAAVAREWSKIGVVTTTDSWIARKLKDVDFLSHNFIEIDGIMLPKPEREKVLASALYANEVADVRFTLLRLFALRIESWPCVETRGELRRAIAYIRKMYANELKGVIPGTQLQWKDIEAVNMTDQELWRLYAYPRLEPGRTKTFEALLSKNPHFDDLRSIVSGVCQSAPVSLGINTCGCCYCLLSSDVKSDDWGHCGCDSEIRIGVPMDYVSPKVSKWRGKGLGSKGFTFILPGDERKVATAVEMPSKQKGGGKPKNPSKKQSKSRGPGKGARGGINSGRQIAAPVAYGSVSQNRQSRVTRITHRESLGPVTSTGTGFTVLFNLPVQPALPASFPWLSAIASQYETYAPRKTKSKRGMKAHCIRYCYEPRCSTGTAGTVVQATNYDAAEAAFTSLTQAENYRGATVCQPWVRACHELEVDSMRDYNRHYTRAGAAVSGTDIKTYDVGNYQLIVSGVAAGQIGELYVEYDIDFFDPRVPVPIGQNLAMWHAASSAGGATNAAPLTGGAVRAGSTLGVTIPNTAQISIPDVGRYLIAVSSYSTALTTSPLIAASTNVSLVNLVNQNANSQAAGFVLNTVGSLMAIADVTAPGGLVSLTAGAGVVAGNYDVFVSQISSGLTKPLSNDIEDIAEKVARLLRAGDAKQSERAVRPIVVDQSDGEDEKSGTPYVRVASATTAAIPVALATSVQAASSAKVGKRAS
jgi:hypothetical protein